MFGNPEVVDTESYRKYESEYRMKARQIGPREYFKIRKFFDNSTYRFICKMMKAPSVLCHDRICLPVNMPARIAVFHEAIDLNRLDRKDLAEVLYWIRNSDYDPETVMGKCRLSEGRLALPQAEQTDPQDPRV